MHLIATTERAIAALSSHGFNELSFCLSLELALFRRGSITGERLRSTANSILTILA